MKFNTEENPIKILLVEDSKHDVIFFKRSLRKYGICYKLINKIRGEGMLDVMKRKRFDVAIVDYKLPGITGLEVCYNIIKAGYKVPIIMITRAGAEGLAIEALRMGIRDYVIKDPNQRYLDLLPLKMINIVKMNADHQEVLDETIKNVKVNNSVNRIVDTIPACIWSLESDPLGNIVNFYCSKPIEDITGKKQSHINADYNNFIKVIHQDDHTKILKARQNALKKGASYEDLEYRVIHADNSVVNVKEKIAVSRNSKGNFLIDGIFYDVSKEKTREDNGLLQELVSRSGSLFVTYDLAERTISYKNRDYKDFFVEEGNENDMFSFFPNKEKNRVKDWMDTFYLPRANPDPFYFCIKNNKYRIFAFPFHKDQHGKIINYLMQIDLMASECDHATPSTKKELGKNSDNALHIINHLSEAVFSVDEKNCLSFYNQTFKDMIGYSDEELKKVNIEKLIASTGKREMLNTLNKARKRKERPPFEISWLDKKENPIKQITSLYYYEELGLFGIVRVKEKLPQSHDKLKGEIERLKEENRDLKKEYDRLTKKGGETKGNKQEKDKIEQIVYNIDKLVLPLIDKLQEKSDLSLKNYFDVIIDNLKNIIDSFGTKLSIHDNLTLREIEICNLVKQGKTSKEIGEILDLSPLTVDKHKLNIRKKLGLNNTNTNLKTYLNRIQ